MNKTRLILLSSATVIIIAVAGYFLSRTANAAGTKSAELQMPDLTPRATGDSPEFRKAQAMLVKSRALIQKDPSVVKNYVDVAQVYLQEGRVSGKHDVYVPLAKALLDKALSLNPHDFAALVTDGGLLMTLHQFEQARSVAQKAIEQFPESAVSYGILCDANTELGKYSEAVAACDKMLSLRPDLRSYSRASYQREIHGDVQGAIDAMKLAVDAGLPGDEARAWALYTLGTLYLNSGHLDTAEFIFRGTLQERPNYAFALSGLAQVAAAKKDYPQALENLVKATQLSQEHIFLEQLSDIYLAMGNRDGAAVIEKKVLSAFDAHQKGGWNVDREYANYCLAHDVELTTARQRAESEYHRRPENIDAIDTYAWALYKTGSATQAAPVIEHALAIGTKNPLLHFHAGMIYKASGNAAKADTELMLALSQNPYLTPATVDVARTALGQLAHAGSAPTASGM